MTPTELRPENFSAYGSGGRALAVQYLAVLRQLPIAVLPSFLQQIRSHDTSFPVERASLRGRLATLAAMPSGQLQTKTAALREVHLSATLLRRDWVNQPDAFITAMTAYLWSTAQIDAFRDGTVQLFSGLPDANSTGERLVMIAIGKGAPENALSSFGKLRRHGILLRRVTEPDIAAALLTMLQARAQDAAASYAHWYVDGEDAWPQPTQVAAPSSNVAGTGVNVVSYASLAPLRKRVLQRMQTTLFDSDAGVEDMQHRLAEITPQTLHASELTDDPVLQRFYTELFTLSSGPQVFSTSFVQWTGRELMRRAQPRTLLMRYAPRQHHRTLDEMVVTTEGESTLDPMGSLRDAEMGAYYTWIETGRITPIKNLTFLVWQEGTRSLLVIAPNAPAGTETATPMSLQDAMRNFA